MTNFEYLRKLTAGLGTSDDDIELILAKGVLNGTDIADMRACDKAVFNNQSIIRKRTVEKVGEGGFSIERRQKELDAFFRDLRRELGLGGGVRLINLY